MFSQLDRTVEFLHLQISITGYQWFDTSSSTWKRVKGNRFSIRYLIFSFYEGQQYQAHLVHPVAVYSHPSQREPLRSILGYGVPTGTGVIPTVEDVIPSSGPAYSHNTTCVTGMGFESPAFVFFGEHPATLENQKATWIKCRTPNSFPGVVSVTVVCAGRPSNDDVTYEFIQPQHAVPLNVGVVDKSMMLDNTHMVIKENFELDTFYSMPVEHQLEYMGTREENFVYCSGIRALHFLASFGKVKSVQTLLKKGYRVDVTDDKGATPLFWSVWGGHTSTVSLLLESSANVNAPNKYGETPLHIACLNGNKPMVELLLKHKASIGSRTKSGETPLFFAAGMGCIEIMKLLISAGGSITNENKFGETCTQWAILGDHNEMKAFLEKETPSVTKRVIESHSRRVSGLKSIKQGHLFKKGGKLGTWQKRYMVLYSHTLTFYKKENKRERKGEIFISSILDIKSITYKDKKKRFSRPHARPHLLLAVLQRK